MKKIFLFIISFTFSAMVFAQITSISSPLDSIQSKAYKYTYRIEGQLFIEKSDSIKTCTLPYLDSMAFFLIKHQNFVIEIIASPNYCCPDKHFQLGHKREIQIIDYLIKNKVKGQQLVALGYGDYDHIIPEDFDSEYKNFLTKKCDTILFRILRLD